MSGKSGPVLEGDVVDGVPIQVLRINQDLVDIRHAKDILTQSNGGIVGTLEGPAGDEALPDVLSEVGIVLMLAVAVVQLIAAVVVLEGDDIDGLAVLVAGDEDVVVAAKLLAASDVVQVVTEFSLCSVAVGSFLNAGGQDCAQDAVAKGSNILVVFVLVVEGVILGVIGPIMMGSAHNGDRRRRQCKAHRVRLW